MEIELKRLPKSKVDLRIEISGSEFESFFKKALEELAKNLEIKGFRQGKVPQDIAKKYLGEEKILAQAIEKAIREGYFKAIAEKKIVPISQPEIEILKSPSLPLSQGRTLVFKLEVQVLPEFELPDYRKIAKNIERRETKVEEREVEESLKWLQKSRAKLSQIQKPCQKGDFVEIEFSSSQIENGKTKRDAFILGEGHLIPGFEENLVGMEANQEKEFSLNFPLSHFQKDLAGREVKLKVKMKSVKKIELPEINDQFARDLGRFENVEHLKKSLREGIKMEKEIAESQRLREEILEKISQETSLELPEILVEREKEKMIQEFKETIERKLGLSFEDYLKEIGKEENEFKETFNEQAQKRIKNFLILEKIAKQENIETNEAEVTYQINEFLKNLNIPPEKLENIDLQELRDYTKEVIINKKTLEFLEGLANKNSNK